MEEMVDTALRPPAPAAALKKAEGIGDNEAHAPLAENAGLCWMIAG
jgi:hypothetical protein